VTPETTTRAGQAPADAPDTVLKDAAMELVLTNDNLPWKCPFCNKPYKNKAAWARRHLIACKKKAAAKGSENGRETEVSRRSQ